MALPEVPETGLLDIKGDLGELLGYFRERSQVLKRNKRLAARRK